MGELFTKKEIEEYLEYMRNRTEEDIKRDKECNSFYKKSKL